MNIQTTYLGMTLKSPLVASASPLAQKIENIRALEDAGAGAVVLHSLYEEEIRLEREALMHHLEYGTHSFAEALTYFPEPEVFYAKTDDYLEHIRRARAAVDIPVIASLNGASIGGWTRFARQMEQAGASAIELNIYHIPTDVNAPGHQIEQMCVEIVRAVKESVQCPVAVKLGPYYSNMANMAAQLDAAGADALVLFNRFYQPDINLETLETEPNILLSTPYDLRLPLRWIAILYGQLKADLAATSGIHTAEDAIKVFMAGANVAMMTSAVLTHGIGHFTVVEQHLRNWLQDHEYESLTQLRGSVSHLHAEDPSVFERVQYMRGLRTYAAKNQRR